MQRGSYKRWTEAELLEMGACALECATLDRAVTRFNLQHPQKPTNKGTLKRGRDLLLEKKRKREDDEAPTPAPAPKKMKNTTLMEGEEEELLRQVHQEREAGTAITYGGLSTLAKAIVHLNGRKVFEGELGYEWARSFARRHTLVLRRATRNEGGDPPGGAGHHGAA